TCRNRLGNYHHLHEFRDAREEPRSAAIVPALIEALTSHDLRVRYHAAAALGDVGADAATSIPALVGMLNEPPDPEPMRPPPPDRRRGAPPARAPGACGKLAPAPPQAGEGAAAWLPPTRTPPLAGRRAAPADGLARFATELTEPALPLLLAVLKETVNNRG